MPPSFSPRFQVLVVDVGHRTVSIRHQANLFCAVEAERLVVLANFSVNARVKYLVFQTNPNRGIKRGGIRRTY
jgi:hypothetical protein